MWSGNSSARGDRASFIKQIAQNAFWWTEWDPQPEVGCWREIARETERERAREREGERTGPRAVGLPSTDGAGLGASPRHVHSTAYHRRRWWSRGVGPDVGYIYLGDHARCCSRPVRIAAWVAVAHRVGPDDRRPLRPAQIPPLSGGPAAGPDRVRSSLRRSATPFTPSPPSP